MSSIAAAEASAASTSTAPTAASAGGNQPTMVASDERIRIANFYAPKGKPGPGLDVYDVQLNNLNGAPAKPILTDVAYGTVSSYVQPAELASTFGMKAVELEALPTGENPDTSAADAAGIGGAIDDGSGAQFTEVLTADDDDAGALPEPLAGMSFSKRMEAGDDGQGSKGPAAPPAPAGKAELLVDNATLPEAGSASEYLALDASCAPPLNADAAFFGQVPVITTSASSSIQSQFAVFATAPGTHQVSVVVWTSSVTPKCAQLTAKQATMSVSLTSGEQAEVFVYGSALDAAHLVVAPITAN